MKAKIYPLLAYCIETGIGLGVKAYQDDTLTNEIAGALEDRVEREIWFMIDEFLSFDDEFDKKEDVL